MEKYTALEDMEDLFIERGFCIDCFDAYCRHMEAHMVMCINTVLLICFIVGMFSFFYIEFAWKHLALMFSAYMAARSITLLLYFRMIQHTEDYTINAKKNVGENVLQRYYAYYDRMSDADKKEIFAQFIASRIGLIARPK